MIYLIALCLSFFFFWLNLGKSNFCYEKVLATAVRKVLNAQQLHKRVRTDSMATENQHEATPERTIKKKWFLAPWR